MIEDNQKNRLSELLDLLDDKLTAIGSTADAIGIIRALISLGDTPLSELRQVAPVKSYNFKDEVDLSRKIRETPVTAKAKIELDYFKKWLAAEDWKLEPVVYYQEPWKDTIIAVDKKGWISGDYSCYGSKLLRDTLKECLRQKSKALEAICGGLISLRELVAVGYNPFDCLCGIPNIPKIDFTREIELCGMLLRMLKKEGALGISELEKQNEEQINNYKLMLTDNYGIICD